MRKYIVLILMICGLNTHAQEYKRNNNWVSGSLAVKFNFNYNPLQFDTFSNLTTAHVTSCISDTNGKFLFYSAGFILLGNDGLYIDNSYKINCKGNDTLFAKHESYIGSYTQMTLILPKKGNQYYVFGVGMSDSVATNYINHTHTEFDLLNYSVVDMDSNNGHGKVIEKNTILADKQHYLNCAMQAVRHGNGKDWWLCKADVREHRFQLYLVKEDTIEGPFYQYIPSTDTVDTYGWFFAQLYFSEDGTRMASSLYGIHKPGHPLNPNRVDLFDFDRCTGTLSYRNHYEVPCDSSTYPNPDLKFGICFSPDGKLVYMGNSFSIYQIDIEDTNQHNAMYITGPDTTYLNFPWYSEMKIAPDGRIYVGTFGVQRPYMSYIAQPNV
ncbi:MAG: hypothetical protein R2831_13045, partial [Chitinophagaceae bacterium]